MDTQVAVVTGASAGIGRATARRFADGGSSVGLIARNEESLANLAEELRSKGVRAVVAPADVADAAQVEAAAERVTEVTYLGSVHGTLAALRRMRPRNRGAIRSGVRSTSVCQPCSRSGATSFFRR